MSYTFVTECISRHLQVYAHVWGMVRGCHGRVMGAWACATPFQPHTNIHTDNVEEEEVTGVMKANFCFTELSLSLNYQGKCIKLRNTANICLLACQ